MTTNPSKKPFAGVTGKKVGIATKQVPAKPAKPVDKKPATKVGTVKTANVKAAGPAKASVPVQKVKVYGATGTGTAAKPTTKTVKMTVKETAAFNAAKTEKDRALVAVGAAVRTKAISPPVVKAKLAANTAVAKANLAKALVKKAQADAKLKNINAAIKKTGADTKGYQIGTAAEQKAFAEKREASKKSPVVSITKKPGQKVVAKIDGKSASVNKAAAVINTALKKAVEPAKKSVTVAVKTTVKSATQTTGASAVKNTTSVPAKSQAGTSKVNTLKAVRTGKKEELTKAVAHLGLQNSIRVEQSPKVVTKIGLPAEVVPTKPAVKSTVPGHMTREDALKREANLRDTFRYLGATMGVKKS